MKYYFQKRSDKISYLHLYSYESLLIGIVAMSFYCIGDNVERVQSYAKIIMGIAFGLCAVFSTICAVKEANAEQKCNVSDILRALICGVMCVISFTCVDLILG